MDKPSDQSGRTGARRGAGSAETQDRLMTAAAGLVAELGWGRVTTRAVAERAGLPHGAVSYHFRGKQELLVEAALHAFADALPPEAFEALGSTADVLALIRAELGSPEAVDPVLSRLMLETMREAERDPQLRVKMAEMMGRYRQRIVDLVRADQLGGRLPSGPTAEGVGTLLAAVGDGLLLHLLLDGELDVAGALDALEALLGGR